MISDMAEHVCREKDSQQPLWNELKIINKERHWRVRHLKVSDHMLGYEYLLTRRFVQINTRQGPIIKKESQMRESLHAQQQHSTMTSGQR